MPLSAFTGALIVITIAALIFLLVNTLVVWLTTLFFDYLMNIEVKDFKKAFFISLILILVNVFFVILMTLIRSILIARILYIADIIIIVCLTVYLFYRYFFRGVYKKTLRDRKRQFRHELMLSIGAAAVSLIIILLLGILITMLLNWLILFLGIGPAISFA